MLQYLDEHVMLSLVERCSTLENILRRIATMQSNQAIGTTSPQEKTVIEIEVNNKQVTLHQREVTGYDIKVAAINQGVALELDFLLYIIRGQGQLDLVKDDEVVSVHEHESFRAVTPDDVSEV